jgi:hypothetical protein
MSANPPRRSALIVRWPLTLGVTLEIDPERLSDDETVGMVALRLLDMGGKLVGWIPDRNRRPAIARFEFADPAARHGFIAKAVAISGVSLAAVR